MHFFTNYFAAKQKFRSMPTGAAILANLGNSRYAVYNPLLTSLLRSEIAERFPSSMVPTYPA